MRNETSQSWYFMPLSILLSSLAAKDIRDNLFLGLFIEGVECLPCAAVTGCPLVAWRPCHAFVGQPSDIVSGQICVLGYFLESAGYPPYCAPQRGQVRRFELLSAFIFAPFCCSPMRKVTRSHQNQNCCNPQGKFSHKNRSATPMVVLRA